MSEAAIERLTIAVERLTLATNQLRDQLARASQTPEPPAVSQPAAAAATEVIVLEELSRVPFPDRYREYVLTSRFSENLEDGSSPLPDFILPYCRARLSNKPPGIDQRAESAYRKGVSAKIALATETPYTSAGNLRGLRASHWICLRSSQDSPFRTNTRRDLAKICRLDDPNLICESFESITEAEIFCLAAHSELPSLRTCSEVN